MIGAMVRSSWSIRRSSSAVLENPKMRNTPIPRSENQPPYHSFLAGLTLNKGLFKAKNSSWLPAWLGVVVIDNT